MLLLQSHKPPLLYVLSNRRCYWSSRVLASVSCLHSVLLQHLQSAGPLNYKLIAGLRKLQREAEIIAELLNIAAEQSAPEIEHSTLLSQ